MTEDQADLVSKSFSLVLPISEVAASLFYSRLFEINPALKPLFKSDMKEQGRKLMSTIGTAVAAARNPGVLVGPLENLATRHVKYGVKPEHFDDVGQALIWTLEQGLGPNFTPATRQAWICLYGELVAIMVPKMTATRAAAAATPKPAANDPRKQRSFFTSVAAFFGWSR
jgi:hemoglobin-like flavoprotein